VIGVVVPVHNEERQLGRALESLGLAFEELEGSGVALRAAIVLDACRDDSANIARSWKRHIDRGSRVGVEVIECDFENVGMARALGCDAVINECPGVHPSSVWLATTDADSRVPRCWLTAQLAWHHLGMDAWVGRVMVNDWTQHRRESALKRQSEYERERRPVHGANLGFVAERYLAVGGFRSLRTGEDRAIVKALLDEGAAVHFDAVTRVATSSRRHARAPKGFASALRAIDASLSRLPQISLAADERGAG
jgi:glycosyltransferase involved in cell wall biosynthesis